MVTGGQDKDVPMSLGKAEAVPGPDPVVGSCRSILPIPDQSILRPRQPDEALMHKLVWFGK